MAFGGESAVRRYVAHVGAAMVTGLRQGAVLFPLTLTSFPASEVKFPLPVAVEMLCGTK